MRPVRLVDQPPDGYESEQVEGGSHRFVSLHLGAPGTGLLQVEVVNGAHHGGEVVTAAFGTSDGRLLWHSGVHPIYLGASSVVGVDHRGSARLTEHADLLRPRWWQSCRRMGGQWRS